MDEDRVSAIIAIVLIIGFLVGVFFLLKSIPADGLAGSAYQAPVETTSGEKPLTKTRCLFTSLNTNSIIEEEAANGYRFTGRVSTFFCDEALAFELREL